MVLLVAHDAGGAEILSSWALRQDRTHFKYALEGPAHGIFESKLGENLPSSISLEEAEFVLCSSGATNFEKDYVTRAKLGGVRCIVWLDHWKRYPERFHELPDEVWVTDRWAYDLFQEEVPGADEVKVVIKGNPFLEDLMAEVKRLKYAHYGLENVLYVHEPGRKKEFLDWVRKHFRSGQLLRERLHPSAGSSERSLAEDIAWADIVVGCDSMALAAAVRARRRVISVLPKEEELHIPFPGIERLYG